MKTEYILDRIKRIHEALSVLEASSSLAPGTATNDLFGELVAIARTPKAAKLAGPVLASLGQTEMLAELHRLCAIGEYELEHHWGNRIQQAADPLAELHSFPYWQNYRKLAKLEVQALRRQKPHLKKILFVGAGPLPLTAFIMAKHYRLDVTNLDVDGDATCCAASWMERILGVNSLPCYHTDVVDFTAFENYDAIVLAALVGLNHEQKQTVLTHLHTHMRSDQVLLVRSVRGLRGLLYPVVRPETLTGFVVQRQIHPIGEVVNSVLIARKTEAARIAA